MGNGYIVVIADDEILEQRYHLVLESAGFDHIFFSDPKDALNFLTVNHSLINIVFIDVATQKGVGAEIATRLAGIDSGLPILVAGPVEPPPADRKIRAVLRKPVAKTALLKAVKRHIRQLSAE